VTSGRAVGNVPANVHVADLLPYEETCSRMAAVVSHGGSSSVYPALSAGAPVLGIPANIDTHLSAAALEESGAGLAVRVEYATAATLQRALRRLIEEPRFKTAAERWAATFARYDTKAIFPALLRDWFARRRG
jgi:UDP:flavonoid glycosyltransferase YjiC (YdhE family)